MTLYGIFIIFFFYVLGEVLSRLIDGFIPGSIIGMLLLFFSLIMGWVRPAFLRQTVVWLTSNMTLFFIPSAVGLMVSYTMIQKHVWAILFTLLFTTLLVLLVVGWIQQKLEKK